MPQTRIVDDSIVEPERKIPIVGEYDVIIAGGGAAGIVAAIASARNGAKTLLLEHGGYLGGSLTAGYQLNFGQPPFASEEEQLIKGITGEIVKKLVQRGGFLRSDGSSPFNPELFKHVTLKMLLEAGVECKFYTTATETVMDKETIQGLIIESKSGREALISKRVIDCTGDGDIAYKAGAPFEIGSNGTDSVQPLNMMFLAGGIDIEKVMDHIEDHPDQFGLGLNRTIFERKGTPVLRIQGFFDTTRRYSDDYDLEVLYTRFGNVPMGSGKDVFYVNMARAYHYNPLDPDELTKAEIMLRDQVYRIIKFLRQQIPGCKNAYLISTNPSLGIRESRRIVGEYVLQSEDVLDGKFFDNAVFRSSVAYAGGGPAHPVEPKEGGKGSTYERKQKEWVEYEIPYEVEVPKKIENLLVAGKCRSASHGAMALTKSAPVCMAEGQSAGTAAALSLKDNVSPRGLDVRKLQKTLVRDGVNLPNFG